MIEVPVSRAMSDTARTVEPSLSAFDAADYLREPGVTALVVIDSEAIVGIVVESDLVAVLAERAWDQSVESFMSTPVVTTLPSTPVGLAADQMQDAGVRHLVVRSTDGAYEGLLTLESIAPYISNHRLRIDWDGDPLVFGATDSAETVDN